MKLLIASDLHGSAYYCRRLLKRIVAEQPDRVLLLGDLLYHGPRNDLPKEYAPKEVIRLLNGIKEQLLCVRGNCDAEVDQMMLEFPIMADYCVIMPGSRMIYATHGHNMNLKTPPPLLAQDVLLHGHTHIPAWQPFGDDNYYLNPGSLSLPKENTPHSYMVLEDDTAVWKDDTGAIYHTLDLKNR